MAKYTFELECVNGKSNKEYKLEVYENNVYEEYHFYAQWRAKGAGYWNETENFFNTDAQLRKGVQKVLKGKLSKGYVLTKMSKKVPNEIITALNLTVGQAAMQAPQAPITEDAANKSIKGLVGNRTLVEAILTVIDIGNGTTFQVTHKS